MHSKSIFHKLVHVDYNHYFVIKIVNCTLCSWSRKSRTSFANISMSNCFPSFIVRWILNFVDHSTHENSYHMNKSDFTVYLIRFWTFLFCTQAWISDYRIKKSINLNNQCHLCNLKCNK